MKEPENISQVIQFLPDYIGFIFYERSPRYAGSHLIKIREAVIPDTIQKVGVFVNDDLKKILQIREILPFHVVQLHGNESVTLCEELRRESLEIVKVFSVGEDFEFEVMKPYIDHVDYFLLDTMGKYYGGNSIPFNWKLIDKYPYQKPFFLGGGVGSDNVHEIQHIRNPFLYAVDANSKLEASPGYKDMDKVKLFRKQLDTIDL